jgi:hypothetical protein
MLSGSKRSRTADNTATSIDNVSTTLSACAHSGDSNLKVLCFSAAAATGCSCYSSGFTLRAVTQPTVSNEEGGNEERRSNPRGSPAQSDAASVRYCADIVEAGVPAAHVPVCDTNAMISPTVGDSDTVIVVSNISDYFDEATLRAVMAAFGKVGAFVLLPADVTTQVDRQALVKYEDAAVAARVVAGLAACTDGWLQLSVAAAPAAIMARHLK